MNTNYKDTHILIFGKQTQVSFFQRKELITCFMGNIQRITNFGTDPRTPRYESMLKKLFYISYHWPDRESDSGRLRSREIEPPVHRRRPYKNFTSVTTKFCWLIN